jgi:hypothetical protein
VRIEQQWNTLATNCLPSGLTLQLKLKKACLVLKNSMFIPKHSSKANGGGLKMKDNTIFYRVSISDIIKQKVKEIIVKVIVIR